MVKCSQDRERAVMGLRARYWKDGNDRPVGL